MAAATWQVGKDGRPPLSPSPTNKANGRLATVATVDMYKEEVAAALEADVEAAVSTEEVEASGDPTENPRIIA